ncbi:MAG: amidohydrolase family protein [Xanthomonadales bacterium]|nr:amidohydrolase [Gammaproteobacteria bacterium]MBT8055214.1 amidohydrolase [Gammaproteobacteria bacterium]NND56956.1 amidohydrolase family protein [Xanthomonadales bacterium]NNK51914.1 amidohydrolase family protein [Xanthomonadales bacterium]
MNSDPKREHQACAFLAPKHVNTTRKPSQRVIDPHCHFYNATDWQIAGALRGPLAYEYGWAVQKILRETATFIEKNLRFFSLSAADELKQLNAWEKIDEAAARNEIKRRSKDHLAELAAQSARWFKGSSLEDAVNDLLGRRPTVFTGLSHKKFGEDFILNAFEPQGEAAWAIPNDLAGKKAGLASILGLFLFLRHIMSPRYSNLCAYQRGFTAHRKSLGVNHCFAAMLDFDYWIGEDDHAPSPLFDQVRLMEKMSQCSAGFMKPIVAYNPWTDIEDNDDSIKLVECAIRNRGFAGVKIYPQMGYYPNKNAKQNYPADGDHPNLCRLDEKLDCFFALCKKLDVPVMTHSEESMGRFPSHKKLGSPEAWDIFFSSAENAGVRVNLAHFGGELGGGRGPWGWTRDFADLMWDPPARNLYGDFGLWDELISGDRQARDRIISLLDEPVSNGETVADRMMFGTDWFMLTFTRPKPDFAVKFAEILDSENVSQDIIDKIFYKNAQKLFNLQASSP